MTVHFVEGDKIAFTPRITVGAKNPLDRLAMVPRTFVAGGRHLCLPERLKLRLNFSHTATIPKQEGDSREKGS